MSKCFPHLGWSKQALQGFFFLQAETNQGHTDTELGGKTTGEAFPFQKIKMF